MGVLLAFSWISILSTFITGFWLIDNANRTEWSPIRSVIIQVIDEIAGVQFVKTSIITDRNGRHDTSPESPVTN